MRSLSYELLAPLIVAGEEAPEEPSVRERGMELMFSKRDLRDRAIMNAFGNISIKRETLTKMGRLLLETALTLSTATVKEWHKEAAGIFNRELPARVISNLACCMVGLRVLETALKSRNLTWTEVFPISIRECIRWLQTGVLEYLLDGRTSNRTVIEQTLEIMDRMGLSDEECKFLKDDQVALYFKGFYDRFTRYIRENAITVEFLQYNQFMKQLRKSELFVEYRTVRFGNGDPKKVAVLDYRAIKGTCDVDGFLRSQIAVL